MTADPDRIVTGLEDAGLSEYEASAYLSVLEQGTAKAVDVARRCSIPAPRIYDVLEDLEERGYVETLDRETLHVRANEPVDVIQDLHKRSERLTAVAGAIEETWERRPRSEYGVDVFKRAETAIDRARTAVADADDSVELAVSSSELPRFTRPLSQLDDDVVVRLSVHRSEETEVSTPDPTDGELTDVATEIRERAYAAPLVANVDGRRTCFAPTGLMPDPFGMTLRGSHVTVVFHWFFQTCLWEAWPPSFRSERADRVFASLPEFVATVYSDWRAGATVPIVVNGIDTATGDRAVVEGTLADVTYTGQADIEGPPSLDDLMGRASIALDTEDGRVSVGGWGAKIEEVETRTIAIPPEAIGP